MMMYARVGLVALCVASHVNALTPSGFSPSPTTSPFPTTPAPVPAPTHYPLPVPTPVPVPEPTRAPEPSPTQVPNPIPTKVPLPAPTSEPTPLPYPRPTWPPSPVPTTPQPTGAPSTLPLPAPTASPTQPPSPSPTYIPTPHPTATPTLDPSEFPTYPPTPMPTSAPTVPPTHSPTVSGLYVLKPRAGATYNCTDLVVVLFNARGMDKDQCIESQVQVEIPVTHGAFVTNSMTTIYENGTATGAFKFEFTPAGFFEGNGLNDICGHDLSVTVQCKPRVGTLPIIYASSGTFRVLNFTGQYPTPEPTHLPFPRPSLPPTLRPVPEPTFSHIPTHKPTKPPEDDSTNLITAAVVGGLAVLVLVALIVCANGNNRKAIRQRLFGAPPGAGDRGQPSASAGWRWLWWLAESGYGSQLGTQLSGEHRPTTAGPGGALGALGVAPAYVIRREELDLDARPFAQGAGGQVYRGTYNGTVVAAKSIFAQTMAADVEEFSREVKMLASLHHPNIVTFYGVSSDYEEAKAATDPNPLASETLFIIEEFCPGGNFEPYTSNRGSAPGTFTPALYSRMVTELLAAVRYMHAQGIAHRDLKPANVLLTADFHVKLADLGLARNFKNTVVTAGVGTPAFMPPEAFDDTETV